jgi:hypothetical protein
VLPREFIAMFLNDDNYVLGSKGGALKVWISNVGIRYHFSFLYGRVLSFQC